MVAFARRSEEPAAGLPRFNVIAIAILAACVALGWLAYGATGSRTPLVVMAIVGALLMPAPRIAQQWERAVVLRFDASSACAGQGSSG
jgi:hypothetical protein